MEKMALTVQNSSLLFSSLTLPKKNSSSPLFFNKRNKLFGLPLSSSKPTLRIASRNNKAIKCSISEVTEEPKTEEKKKLMRRADIRNIAIVAHVDHGKTTLVDAMLKQTKVFRDNQTVQERIMDSNDLERERGITILSKNTSVTYKDAKINIIDTPGHSDFGGEVERILNMVEGILLVVDSVEGPMPQTRFVLKKALEFGHAVVVVVNKIDRSSARPDFVVNSTFELFIELNATDEQCDFQVIYASGIKGKAGLSPEDLADDLGPLFESIMRCIPGPRIDKDGSLQMLVTSTEYEGHKGRIAIGRLEAGVLEKGMEVKVCTSEDSCRYARVSELYVYEKFFRVPAQRVEAGDICAVCGISDVQIGETIADKLTGKALPSIKVEEPTVKMSFSINTSPFVGREGKYVTSRNLRDRLYRELERNLAMKVEDGETADTFIVSGRGTLHITILIENMRREGYEFMVGPPKVINKKVDDKVLEPYEIATVEVPEEHMGSVVELLGQRRGQMFDMQGVGSEGTNLLKYKIPTRGLLGLRNAILTASRGTAILNTIFDSYGPWAGDMSTRDLGSLVAFENGTVTSYAIASSQERGQMFVGPGAEVYKGQIIGIHQRPGDLSLNVCIANDLSAAMMKPITDTYMDGFVKDYHDRMQTIMGAEAAAAGQPQPPPPQQPQPPPQSQTFAGEGSSQQGAYAPIHPMMLDYMFGHANWMNEVSDQEYWNRPRFGQEFTEAVCLNRRKMTGSFERFDGSEEAMDHYFDVTRGRAQDREQEIRADFAAGGAQSRQHFGEDTYAEEDPNTWIPEDQMQD